MSRPLTRLTAQAEGAGDHGGRMMMAEAMRMIVTMRAISMVGMSATMA